MKNFFIAVFISACLFLISFDSYGQSFIFGPKLGGTFGTQTWNGFDRNALLTYHGGLFIESYREEAKSSFIAYLGYNKRGSSQRGIINSGLFSSRQSFEFNNATLALAAKNRFNTFSVNKAYYLVGVRFEYTLGTNLDQYLQYGGFFPVEPFVNKFNYGPIAGVGYEMQFSEFVGAFIEASLSPDLSKQYEQPALSNVISPITGQVRNINSQTIRNITFEISVGLRLLRKVILID